MRIFGVCGAAEFSSTKAEDVILYSIFFLLKTKEIQRKQNSFWVPVIKYQTRQAHAGSDSLLDCP